MRIHRILLGFAVFAIVATGCAMQAVSSKVQSEKARAHVQKCAGAGGDHRTCMEIASTVCRTGFDIVEQSVAEEDGVLRRGYYFQCKP